MACEIEYASRIWKLIRKSDGFYLRVDINESQAVDYKLIKPRADEKWRIVSQTDVYYSANKKQAYKEGSSEMLGAVTPEMNVLIDDAVHAFKKKRHKNHEPKGELVPA